MSGSVREWRRWVITGTAGSLAAAGLLVAPSASSAPAPRKVQANDFRFCEFAKKICRPGDRNFVTTVPRGTRVTWYYTDKLCDAVRPCPGHNVVFSSAAGPIVKRQGAVLLSLVFNTRGTFTYVCTIHAGIGMTGRVVVT